MSSSGELAGGWVSIRLGEVGRWYGGGTPSKFEPRFWTAGTIPWISPKDMKVLRILDSEDHITSAATTETNVKAFPPGTVLIVIRSGILSRTLPVGLAEVSGTMNQDLKGVRPREGIDPLFVAYQLIGREREVLQQCSKHGTTVASIDTERLRDFPLRLAPIAEQRRIVAKIEELFSDLDAGVAALERVKPKLKRYRASVLKAAVEGRLTAEWRQQHPDTEPASKLLERILAERRAKWEADQLRKFAEAGKTPPKAWRVKYRPASSPASSRDFPSGWCIATIDQLCPIFVDCAHRTPKYSDNGSPALRPRDVVNGTLRLESAARVSESEFAIQTVRRVPEPGDIIYSRELSCGWGVIVPPTTRLCMSQGMVLFRPSPEVLDRYLLLVVNGPVGREQAMAGATGSAHPHINLDAIRGMEVPLPTLAEQSTIVAEVDRRLSVVEAIEAEVEHALQRAARLRQAILKHAFEGRLVPQDPTDEPAERLSGQDYAEIGNDTATVTSTTTRKRGRMRVRA